MRARWAAGALAALLVLAILLSGGGGADEESGAGASAESGESGRQVLDEVPEPVGNALSSAEASGYESERTLVEEGREVLERFRSRGDCVLARAGYLDLTGRAWGCVTQGEGWVEICIVREAPDGDGCSVVSWHMDAEDVAAVVEEGG